MYKLSYLGFIYELFVAKIVEYQLLIFTFKAPSAPADQKLAARCAEKICKYDTNAQVGDTTDSYVVAESNAYS